MRLAPDTLFVCAYPSSCRISNQRKKHNRPLHWRSGPRTLSFVNRSRIVVDPFSSRYGGQFHGRGDLAGQCLALFARDRSDSSLVIRKIRVACMFTDSTASNSCTVERPSNSGVWVPIVIERFRVLLWSYIYGIIITIANSRSDFLNFTPGEFRRLFLSIFFEIWAVKTSHNRSVGFVSSILL